MIRTITLITAMLSMLFPAGGFTTAEPSLKSAKITFIPTKDDKDTDTKVTVSVTVKFNNQFDLTLASRNDFAGSDTWEDKSGKEYTYDLEIPGGVTLSQIKGDIKTNICINPVGNDTVKFNYRLILLFKEDGSNAKPTELRQENGEITLSQDNKCWHN